MSLDFSPYVNLRIYDKDPGEVYLTALEVMRLNIPQLSIRPGTIEDAMVQAFAFISTIGINHINLLPNRLVEGIANLMGAVRTESTYATVPVRLTALDYAGGSLESGTVFEHTYFVSGERISEYYELNSGITIEPVEPNFNASPITPLPTFDTTVTSLDLGQRQTIATGTVLKIINSQNVADSAVALGGFNQGALGEDDAQFLSRFATQLQSMSNVLTTAKQIEAYVLSTYIFVSRAKAYDLTNSESNRTVGAANVPGYVSLFLYGDDRELSLFERNLIYKDLTDKIMAGLQIVVQDMIILPMTITAQVKISDGSDFLSTKSAVEQSLIQFFSPSGFSLIDGAIRKTTVFSQINSVNNVAYVDQAITITCSNTSSDGNGNLVFTKKGSLPLIDIANSTITLGYL